MNHRRLGKRIELGPQLIAFSLERDYSIALWARHRGQQLGPSGIDHTRAERGSNLPIG